VGVAIYANGVQPVKSIYDKINQYPDFIHVDIVDKTIVDGASENNFNTEETSEYHPLNISKYPKYKKYMDKFIEISSSRHMDFEKIVNAKKRHKLKFANINSYKVQSNEVLDQLKKLKSLYEEGVLTEEEFNKAKKKILE